MKRDNPRSSTSFVIPSDINKQLLYQDPVLASIADMIESENNGARRGHGSQRGVGSQRGLGNQRGLGSQHGQDNQRDQGNRNGQQGRVDQGGNVDQMVKMEAMLDRKLNQKLAPLHNRVIELERNIEELRNQVHYSNMENRNAIDRQGQAVEQIMGEVTYLMNRDNEVQQRDRNPGQRIDNFPVPENISPLELQDKIYNELYRPMFVQAAKEGLLPKREVVNLDQVDENGHPTITKSTVVDLPLPGEVIEYCHTLSGGRPANLPVGAQPRRAARTPTIIVKLKGRNTKEIIIRNKKAALQKYNTERKLGNKDAVYLYDDLTKANLNCLNKLQISPLVREAFALGGKIRFNLKSDPLKNYVVHNVYGNDLQQLTRFPLNPLMM